MTARAPFGALLGALSVLLPLAAAAAEPRVEIGVLDCRLTDSTNLIIVSGRTFACTFDPAAEGAPEELYTARIDKLGLDLTSNTEERMRWLVLAPTTARQPGVLKGPYVGASADAALGAGAGVRALVGGLEDSIALQPVSLTTVTGVGLSAAVERMELDFDGVRK